MTQFPHSNPLSPNCNRLTVQSPGPWRLYTQPIHGWEMLGTVQRGKEVGDG